MNQGNTSESVNQGIGGEMSVVGFCGLPRWPCRDGSGETLQRRPGQRRKGTPRGREDAGISLRRVQDLVVHVVPSIPMLENFIWVS